MNFSPEIYQQRLSRRALLRGVVFGGLGLAAAATLGCEEEPTTTATHVYQGEAVILRGVNIRTEPKMKSLGGPTDNNTIPWSQITAINGVKLNGADAFLVENPPIVYGESPANFVDRSIMSPWIQVIATVKGPMKDRKVPVYINMSPFTRQTVLPDSLFAQDGIEPVSPNSPKSEITPLSTEALKSWLSPERRLEKALVILENSSPEVKALVQKYEVQLLDENTYKSLSNGSLGPVGLALISDQNKNWEGETRFSLIGSSKRVRILSPEELAVDILKNALTADAGNNFTVTTAERIAYAGGIKEEMQAQALELLTENGSLNTDRIHNPLLKAALLAKQDGSKPSPLSQK